MDDNPASLPFKYARLIIAFTHNRLTDAEQDELDRWVEASDGNLETFEALTEGMDADVFRPEDLIIETDDLLDAWMVAGLIARQMQGIITADERRTLDAWIEGSERNKTLYHTFTDKGNLQNFASWYEQVRRQNGLPTGLN